MATSDYTITIRLIANFSWVDIYKRLIECTAQPAWVHQEQKYSVTTVFKSIIRDS